MTRNGICERLEFVKRIRRKPDEGSLQWLDEELQLAAHRSRFETTIHALPRLLAEFLKPEHRHSDRAVRSISAILWKAERIGLPEEELVNLTLEYASAHHSQTSDTPEATT